jgi:CRP-like cAMP-binding protein
MVASEQGNAILSGLAVSEWAMLESASHDVVVDQGQLIAEAGQLGPSVYFPTEAVFSLIGRTANGNTVELAIVGNDGVANLSAIFGSNWLPFRVVTQVPGRAVRVPAELVSRVVAECGDLHQRMLHYTHQLIAQIAQSAICNRFHNARQRLARWLLMTADRADADKLPLTHEFIAHMVGGPRSAVTEAASELREVGAIDYRRALILIRDRDKLRAQSCECYAVLQTDKLRTETA